MVVDISSELNNVTGIIASIAALGTAAFGLVDVTKVFWGGVSNAGFGYIKKALDPFATALVVAGGENWAGILRAHWINGRAKDDQKAIAKSLIHLGLSSKNAAALAAVGGVSSQVLTDATTALEAGNTLTANQITVLGRLDAMIEAALDGGFERADQRYSTAAEALAAVFAVLLAVSGQAIITADNLAKPSAPFVETKGFWLSILVGIIAVPLAPVAKDLTTALTTAVRSMKALSR